MSILRDPMDKSDDDNDDADNESTIALAGTQNDISLEASFELQE